MKCRSVPKEDVSSEQNYGYLLYLGGLTQLYRDFKKPSKGYYEPIMNRSV